MRPAIGLLVIILLVPIWLPTMIITLGFRIGKLFATNISNWIGD